MKRILKKVPVFILIILLLAGCVVLSSMHFKEEKKVNKKVTAKDGITLVCPKLSRCGDAFLLYDDQEAVIIDTGEKKDVDVLLDLLKEREITSVEALILTHFDKDHIGGAPAVLERIPVDRCYMTCGSEDNDEFRDLMRALNKAGTEQIVVTEPEEFQAMDVGFTIYPPLTEIFEKDQDNNLSLIISIDAPQDHLLFTGDAEDERMDQYMESQYDGTQYNWLKVPHHGRDKSTVKQLLKEFVPKDAVITSSDEEPEKEKVVKILEEAGVSVHLLREKDAEFQISKKKTSSEKGKSAKKSASQGDEKAKKTSAKKEKKVEAPVFSKESGFYKKSFDLKIKAPKGTRIYYTLDCSEPDKNSSVYKKSIKIEDTTSQPNNHSARLDMQPYRHQNFSRYYAKVTEGWFSRNIPPGNVDKCQIVRAIAVDEDGNKSDVATASYFIGYEKRKGYDNISILSLVSDPDDLFSDEKGIMVNGPIYREKWLSGEIDDVADTHVTRKYCNTYRGRGIDWERKVHMDFFDEKNQTLVFNQEAGIRLHGNQSRVTQSQKSFNLYARDIYDGNETFKIPFYDDGILEDNVTLMRGDDPRNYMLSVRMNNRTMCTQKYRMVQVFLDGEYWGAYAIQEKYNSKEYLKAHYNLDSGEYILAKGTPTGYVIKKGDPDATKKSFRMLRDFLAQKDMSKEENYQMVCNMMDMQSFVDGYGARLYLSDQDWNWFKNHYLLFYDQKWHWMVFDMDYGASWYANTQPDTNTFLTNRLISKYNLANDPFFPYLKQNKKFRRMFVNTFLDLGNEVFRGNLVRKDVDAFNDKYEDVEMVEDYRHITTTHFDEHDQPGYKPGIYRMSDKMALFCEQRLPYAAQYVGEYFGLEGNLATIKIVNKDDDKGTVKLNTITPTLDKKGQWTGVYYTDYTVDLKAEPKRGYEFTGWKVSKNGEPDDKKAAATELAFTGDVTVEANFVKK